MANNNDRNILKLSKTELVNYNQINILLGKNGSGKSSILREMADHLQNKPGIVRYISPERGGALQHNSSVLDAIDSNPARMLNSRKQNQCMEFRTQSAAQYSRLEYIVLREIEKDKRKEHDYAFDRYLERINSLLENIEIRRTAIFSKKGFEVYEKNSNNAHVQPISITKISSGESELISLAIECMVFEKECDSDKENYLLVDELDVHLHPDSQVKLCEFIIKLFETKNIKIFIATHSTPILAGFSDGLNVHVGFVKKGQAEVKFSQISEEYKNILPVFGAHPLSSIFNKKPILLVEGDDDVRIWQKVVRSCDGGVNLYPCAVDSENKLKKHEEVANKILTAIYDNAKIYSLRDGDDIKDEISDDGIVVKFRLCCRAAENLLLTDEVLESCNISWSAFQTKIDSWLMNNETHKNVSTMQDFKNKNYPRKSFNLKAIRNDLLSLLESQLDWEILVGKNIATFITNNCPPNQHSENSISAYLGKKLVDMLISNSPDKIIPKEKCNAEIVEPA